MQLNVDEGNFVEFGAGDGKPLAAALYCASRVHGFELVQKNYYSKASITKSCQGHKVITSFAQFCNLIYFLADFDFDGFVFLFQNQANHYFLIDPFSFCSRIIVLSSIFRDFQRRRSHSDRATSIHEHAAFCCNAHNLEYHIYTQISVSSVLTTASFNRPQTSDLS
jgi:hypothetical protein